MYYEVNLSVKFVSVTKDREYPYRRQCFLWRVKNKNGERDEIEEKCCAQVVDSTFFKIKSIKSLPLILNFVHRFG